MSPCLRATQYIHIFLRLTWKVLLSSPPIHRLVPVSPKSHHRKIKAMPIREHFGGFGEFPQK